MCIEKLLRKQLTQYGKCQCSARARDLEAWKSLEMFSTPFNQIIQINHSAVLLTICVQADEETSKETSCTTAESSPQYLRAMALTYLGVFEVRQLLRKERHSF
jgi:hypothetical protein